MIANSVLDLGLFLREARSKAGLSQQQLAQRIGVSRQWVINVEKGAPTAHVGLVLTALRVVDLLIDVVEDPDTDLMSEAHDGWTT